MREHPPVVPTPRKDLGGPGSVQAMLAREGAFSCDFRWLWEAGAGRGPGGTVWKVCWARGSGGGARRGTQKFAGECGALRSLPGWDCCPP